MTRATAVASENGTRSAATAISVSELVVRFDGDAGSVTALDKPRCCAMRALTQERSRSL